MFSPLFAATLALAAADVPPAPAPRVAPPTRDIGYLSGSDLFQRCSETAFTSASYCFAYIAAVHDTVRAYEVWLNVREFCPPAQPSQSNLRDMFLTYARNRPADLRGQASSIVLAALKQNYPCAAPAPAPAPAAPVKP